MHLRVLLPLGFSLLALAAGFGGGQRHQAVPRLIGFDTYYEPVGYFDATQLVRIDPETLRRLPGRPLKLHDYAESRIVSPDGQTLAVGGYNYGQVILVDLARLARTAWVKVARRKPDESVYVDVVSWPRPDRMLAVVSPVVGDRGSSRLVVIDPSRRRVLRSVLLGGEAWGWLRLRDGRGVFLVSAATVRSRRRAL